MEKNPFKWPIIVLAGILVWLTEIWFNIPSILLWPSGDFSPFANYHSDLGNTSLNSALGVQFYNSGQVFQGLAIILFAGGLYVFYGEKLWTRILIILGQLSTFLIGFGLIMNGIYSENFQPWHGIFSEVIFYNIFIAELLVNIPLLTKSKFYRIIGIFGLVAAGINLFFVVGFDLFAAGQIIEWIGVYVAEAWLAIITIGVFYTEILSKKNT
ncbi:MAG: DUF998 domain-containing protein [Candidatus Lokiarchaeota archaeon]|nr:DUF998 domain-containing protein [Candidatus Lokiarchaeota archaeon]MBD3199137.1 DUF998 domain-containing protein [Candidatus Lokiarchaeota archaeon]